MSSQRKSWQPTRQSKSAYFSIMPLTKSIEEKFILLLQLATGQNTNQNIDLSEEEWLAIYNTACIQSLVDIVFNALEILNHKGLKPPLKILCDWIGSNEQIK